MGSSKNWATKARTRARTAPVAIGGAWDHRGEHVADAAVRAAAANLAGLGLRSTAHRGGDVLGIKAAKSTRASEIWVEHPEPSRWYIRLGVDGVNYGQVVDWMLGFDITGDPDGRVVQVTTPAVATRNGSQLNKGAFSETRDLVLTGLTSGIMPASSGEVAVSTNGLTQLAPDVFGCRAGAESRDHTLVTSLSVDEVGTCLRRLCFPVREVSPTEMLVRFGTATSGYSAALSISDLGAVRHVRVSYTLPTPGRSVRLCIVVLHASTLPGRVLEAMQRSDPAATVLADAESGQPGAPPS